MGDKKAIAIAGILRNRVSKTKFTERDLVWEKYILKIENKQ